MFMRILVFAFLSILTCPNHLPAVDIFQEQRQTMVTRDIKGRGIRDRRVLAAMEKIPRHLLVGERYRHEAYADRPLPIGEGQTISQPYVVALMTEALKLVGMAHPRAKVYQPISSSLLSPGKMARAVPLAAKPSMAMLMTMKAKWYQMVMAKTRVSSTSKARLAMEARKISGGILGSRLFIGSSMPLSRASFPASNRDRVSGY